MSRLESRALSLQLENDRLKGELAKAQDEIKRQRQRGQAISARWLAADCLTCAHRLIALKYEATLAKVGEDGKIK